ncbi:MAG: hypothetical protein Q9219_000604 [cf. Caloplaca sp. 3 TL-2023]
MPSKWTEDMEVQALLSLIHHLHGGKPKIDRQTSEKISADLAGHNISAQAARQHVQQLLRSFTPTVGNASSTGAANPSTSSIPSKKRKASGSSAAQVTSKRTKTAAAKANKANPNDDQEEEGRASPAVKEESEESEDAG